VRPGESNVVQASPAQPFSEQRLALALRTGRMGTWEWNVKDDRACWSPEAQAITGLAPMDPPGTLDQFFQHVFVDDRARLLARVDETFRSGCDFEAEFRIVRPDGELRWVRNMGQLLRDEAGEPAHLVGIVHDVTERRAMEEALRASEERFRRAVMAIPFPVAILADDGEMLTLNDAWVALSGYRREEIATIAAWTDHAARDGVREAARVQIAELFTSDSVTQNGEWEVLTADGRARIWDISTAPLGRALDSRRLIISVAMDVTERRATERALRESRERLQASLAASQTGTYRWDLDTNEVEWDENLERLFGCEPGELEPSLDGFFAKVHPDDRAAAIEGCARCVRDGSDFNMEFRVALPDDRVRWLEDRGRTFYDAAGRPSYMVGACIDVTRKKITAIELQHAKESAERASRAKDDFLATVSHELRTPLTAMLGWARMINMPGLRAGVIEEGMKSIERNARAQAQLVEDLLDISRIISGKLEVCPRPMDLGAVIEAAATTLRPVAEAKRIALTLDLAPGAGFLDGDADRLQQVVANLLSNAVKFTPAGGAVHVELSPCGAEAMMRVSDTGEGIAPDFLPLVFDRFKQADASSTRRHGGLGLGLAIVWHVIELHGGTIRAESQGLGQGATFIVRLPRRDAVEPVREPPDALPIASTEPLPGTLDGLHVLVVDDEPDTRSLVQTVLERAGAQVTAVESVARALEVLKDPGVGVLDVLISDIAMPGEDGYTLMRRLQKEVEDDVRQRVPAVALTAHARVEDRIRALSSGFQSHVAKPVEPRELVAVVASLADRRIP
jgi:PAS domain S-box-containing protein